MSETTYRFESCRGHEIVGAPVAQLDRVPGYGPGGRGFESLRAHFGAGLVGIGRVAQLVRALR